MARNRLALGAITMAACNAVKIVLQLALAPTLARLLGPENFGLYSLAQPSIMFVMMLADAGLGQSLARESEDKVEVWSSAFWLLLGLGLVLASAVSLWSFPLSIIAHQSQLPWIMAPLSVCIVLLTLTVSPTARLTRRGRIEAFSLIDLLANVFGAAVALGAAFAGAGVWSLVAQSLTQYGVRAVALNILAFKVPSLTFNWRSVSPHTLLGGAIVATKFVDSFGRMLESTFVSRRFGSTDLGAYAFTGQAAWSLVQAVNNPAGTMMYVHTLNSPDPGDIKRLYRQLMRVVSLTTLPPMALIAGVSSLLAVDVLGKVWLSAALLITTVFPSQALGTLGQLSGAVLYAQGRARNQTWLALIYVLMRIGAVLTPIGGWPAVALYIGLANTIYFFLGLINARIQLGWSISETLAIVRGPIIASLATAIGAYFLSSLAPNGVVGLIGVMALGGVLFSLSLALFDFTQLRLDWDQVTSLLKQRRARSR